MTLDGPVSLTKAEWLERYKRRFMEVAGLDATQAQRCADAEDFETLSDMFEDDPEGAADEEMSYWGADV